MPNKITISANIHAPLIMVWEGYTLPEHITQWNFADPSWQCPSASNDLKVGGKYSARMEAKDGSFGFDFEAIYTEVAYEKKLSYRMLDGRNADITFNAFENTTEVTIVFDPENIHPEEFQKAGWQAILNNFKSYIESLV